jgi:hypothetical protein
MACNFALFVTIQKTTRKGEEMTQTNTEPQPKAWTIDQIIDYENGDLAEDETVELFQALVDDGSAWTLQGSYGRMAIALIEAGLVEA